MTLSQHILKYMYMYITNQETRVHAYGMVVAKVGGGGGGGRGGGGRGGALFWGKFDTFLI